MQVQMPIIYYNIIFMYFMIIALIGFSLLLFIINLRHDAILYAKTVNKVREYFYNKSDLDINEYDQFVMLPIVSTKPKYFEKTFFFPLILVFSIINCGLVYSAFSLKLLQSPYLFNYSLIGDFKITSTFIWIITIIFFFIHFLFYAYLSNRRNSHYLKNYSFGVDIDGVLNNQTDNFIKWIKI